MTRRTARRIRVVGVLLFVTYTLLMFYFLFFAESFGRTGMEEYRYNLIPFQEIKRYLLYPEQLGTVSVLNNLAGNVIGFLPFGIILPILNRSTRKGWKLLLLSFEFSALVEAAQLITRMGSFDVDDIILNTVGGMLGYAIFAVSNCLRRKYYG